jgi:hypothetical protein
MPLKRDSFFYGPFQQTINEWDGKIGMVRDLKGDFAHPKLAEDHHLSKHVLYRAHT